MAAVGYLDTLTDVPPLPYADNPDLPKVLSTGVGQNTACARERPHISGIMLCWEERGEIPQTLSLDQVRCSNTVETCFPLGKVVLD